MSRRSASYSRLVQVAPGYVQGDRRRGSSGEIVQLRALCGRHLALAAPPRPPGWRHTRASGPLLCTFKTPAACLSFQVWAYSLLLRKRRQARQHHAGLGWGAQCRQARWAHWLARQQTCRLRVLYQTTKSTGGRQARQCWHACITQQQHNLGGWAGGAAGRAPPPHRAIRPAAALKLGWGGCSYAWPC